MRKRFNKTPKPKYITIRIQYYPLDIKLVYVLFALLYFLFSISVIRFTSHFGKIIYTRSVPGFIYHSVFASQQDGENFATPKRITDKVVLHGPRDKKEVALTFDADMTPGMKSMLKSGEVNSYYGQSTIDILNQTQTKATLFLTGMWIEEYPEATRSLADNPLFELGSHSYSHPSFFGNCYGLQQISESDKENEIQKTQMLLKNTVGVEARVFRFPGGCHSQSDINLVNKNGLTVIDWDVAGVDGFNDDKEAIENNILGRVQNGSIIVLHMNGYPNDPKTAEALPKIIAVLKERGFEFVKISELLNIQNPVQTFGIDQNLYVF